MKMKRILSIVVILCMVMSLLPVGVWAACAHEYVAEVYPATCTEGGFTVYACSLCGDAYIGDEVEPLNHPEYVDGFCALCGSGQPAVENGDYYEISNAAQLYWFAEQVNSGNTSINGKLMNDIVVNENVLKEDGTLNGDGSHFKVWTPIGNNVKKFAGIFDGNGKTVSGLYFNNTSNSYIGLFGYAYYGEVKDVGVVDSYLSGSLHVGGVVGYNYGGTVSDCYNTGSVSGSCHVGGVVGHNDDGTVSNCYNTGSVSSTDAVGGVVGCNYSNGKVSNCYNTGSVSGSNYFVGGVVGYNYYYGDVSNSYNTGSVSGSYDVGGVVGDNNYHSTVSNSYNTGSVSGNERVGGVAGDNSGTVSNCYNTGSVSGDSYVGGVVGYNYSSTVSNCYYLESCVSKNNGCGTAKTAEQFVSGEVAYLLQRNQDEHIWGQNIGVDRTPTLFGDWVYLSNSSYVNCSGHNYANGWCVQCSTIQEVVLNGGVYEIFNAGQLYWFAEQVNGGNSDINGKLMADIVVNENVLKEDGTLNGDGSHFKVWTPIGHKVKKYSGTFDGNGNTVSGLYINTGNDYVGLFGYVDSGCIQNVGVVDSYLSGNDYVGGVVGLNYGTVSDSYNTGSVSGSYNVGGVVGSNYGTVSNSYNTGSVSGNERVGGVVGDNYYYGDVTNSYNTGSVSGTKYVGGVVGCNAATATIQNCFYRISCAKDGANKIQFGFGCETVGSNVRDTAGITVGKSTVAFASGEVAYLLQGKQTDPIWGQGIGLDPSPVLNGQPVHFIYGEYTNEVCQHEYQAVVTQPTCTVGGYTTYTCIACGESYTGDVTAPAPHSLVDGLCSVCGKRMIYFYNADEWNIVNYYAWYDPNTVVSNAWPGNLMTKVEGEVYYCSVPADIPNIIFNNKYNQTADLIVPSLESGKNFYDYGSDRWCVYTSEGAHQYSSGQCTICGAEQPFVGVSVSGNVTSYLEGDTTIELIQDGEVVYSVTVSGGEYAIEGVVAGEYTLRISKANHAPVEMTITVGDEAVTQDATICPIGDVTGDGNVNIKDFQRLLRHINKTNPLTDYELACGDVTGDGNCNIKDFQRLLRHVNKTYPLH